MARFKKKPVEIEAVKCSDMIYAAKNCWQGLTPWLRDAYEHGNVLFLNDSIEIFNGKNESLSDDGWSVARREDWIIRGISGEIYPCRMEIFEETYSSI